jgi:transglutaminase-like putative cysteine protease
VSAIPRPRSLRLELACFGALAAFVSLQWAALVAGPPVLRTLLVVAIATGAGAALAALGASRLSRARRLALAGAVLAAALVSALLVTGLPAGLLLPSGWRQLARHLGDSLDAVSNVPIPYDGADRWTRLVILLATPVALALAAAASFGPRRRGLAGRIAGLAVLLALVLTAITWRSPGAGAGQGLALVVLVAAWLWLPALPAGRIAGAALATAAAALIAIPIVSAIDRGSPLFDYRSWRLFGAAGIGFSWDHTYGPLDWPQRGALLLKVASDGAHYWKAETLDDFDGTRWRRSEEPPVKPLLGVPVGLRHSEYVTSLGHHSVPPAWFGRIDIQVRGLRSDLVIGAGTTLNVRNVDAHRDPWGTWKADRPLEEGDSYTVVAYTPDPAPSTMRRAPTSYPRRAAARYTSFSVPDGSGGVSTIRAPYWGREGAGRLSAALQGTPYERMYRLARRLTAGAPTPYDAAARIRSYLASGYAYDQGPPEHAYPLPAFLFQDRRGYCQQFSGAMALMLRMVGVPSRVATGFAPGGRDPDNGVFLVEDLDAHSWVEVYFPGLGWVPFEPTPPQAPAEAQLNDNAVGDTLGAADATHGGGPGNAADPGQGGAQQTSSVSDGSGVGGASGTRAGFDPGGLLGWVALALAAGLAALYPARVLRRRRLSPGRRAAAELRELDRAAGRLGLKSHPAATLVELERRLGRLAGPRASAYAARLRAYRFQSPRGRPPTASERRALRLSLLAAAGPRRAPALLLALPPGGPSLRATEVPPHARAKRS